uniref:Ovule protein n=1 Tax=Strongyloides papillosus TaxID=174720 RepID=A0A0N5BYH4_STREA
MDVFGLVEVKMKEFCYRNEVICSIGILYQQNGSGRSTLKIVLLMVSNLLLVVVVEDGSLKISTIGPFD